MDTTPPPMEPADGQASPESAPIPRPTSVTLLALGVLIFTCLNMVRFVLSLVEWKFLDQLLQISPLYLALTGLTWTLVGSLTIWGLWKTRPGAPRLMQAVALTYALYYWLDHLFLVDHPASTDAGFMRAILPINWPFSAGVTVVCLAFVAWTFQRKKVKAYFGMVEAYTQLAQPKNEQE